MRGVGQGDGGYSGEKKQTDSCEKKSSEGEKVVVVQPGWQYFNAKFKISIGTYNACYNRAVRQHKKLNPTKTTIPKKTIGDEIMKHMAASKEAGKEKFRRKVKFSKGEAVGSEKLKAKMSEQKVVVEGREAPVDAPSPQAAVLQHPPPHSLQPASAKPQVEKESVVNTRKNAVEKVVPLNEATKVASTENVKFQCGICRKDFKYPKALQTHMSAHKEKSFQCPNCPKTFNSRKTLKKHLKKEVIECHCGDKFTSQVGLIKHQKSVHEMASCEKCPFEGTVASLAVHMHNNHRIRPKKRKGQQFACKGCPKVYSDQTTLRRHVKVAHPQEENRVQVEVVDGHPDQVADKQPDHEKDGHPDRVAAGPQVREEVAVGPPVPPQSDASHSTAGPSRPANPTSTPLHATFPHSLAMYPHFPYPVPNQHPYFYPPVQIGAFGGALSGSAAAQVGQRAHALTLGDKCDYEKAGLPVD